MQLANTQKHMNNNTTVANAIATLNEAANKRAEEKAAGIIRSISAYQMMIGQKSEDISALQKELKAVENDVFSFESIVGQTPGNTANTETVVNTINSLNKARQNEVSGKASRLGQAILSAQEGKAALEKEVAKLREDLAKITPEVVNETAILG